MYLVELRPGKEELYRTGDELAAAIRSGEVDGHSRIYHRSTSKWISITLHPQYKAILAEKPARAPADDSGWVLATADQAHRHLNPTKRDRAKADRAGLTTELITMRHYRDHIGAQWECEEHRAAKPAPAAPVV